jgi:hypothetical protein
MTASDRNRTRRRILTAVLLWTISIGPAFADDAETGKLLKDAGAKLAESKGFVTSVDLADASKLTDADFLRLAQLDHLKSLSLGKGIDDARLAQLAKLPNLDTLQTNLAQISDDGILPLAKLTSLHNLKFFHPSKSFTGAGLAHLAKMPNLDRLTVAGSFEFNDAGMAAVAELSGLKELRTWHAGATNDGVKKLKALKKLTSLHLGQRLTYKAPACPNDETIAILADMPALESLILDEARLSLTALQQFKKLPTLKKLTLSGIDLPKADVDRLKAELPAVKVEWTEPSEQYRKRIGALFGSQR